MNIKSCFTSICAAVILFSCSHPRNQVTTASLLSTSSETVSLSVLDTSTLQTVKNFILEGKPSSAQVSCPNTKPICKKLINLLQTNKIEYKEAFLNEQKVLLIYEKTNAKNCPSSAFGCSVSANMLQMSKDYKQFVSPDTLDKKSAAAK